MNRRKFLKSTSLAAAVAPLVVTNFKLFGAETPSNKLNLALVGTWGRGEAHFDSLATQNVVALCDINEDHLAFGLKKFPGAKTYVDWRKMLDDHQTLGLDGVVICSLDHTHAFVSNWALNRGLHVYCEKPLANTVEEARVVQANYQSKKNKLATPRLPKFQSHPRTHSRRRHRRTLARLRLGQPPTPPARLSACGGRAAIHVAL